MNYFNLFFAFKRQLFIDNIKLNIKSILIKLKELSQKIKTYIMRLSRR